MSRWRPVEFHYTLRGHLARRLGGSEFIISDFAVRVVTQRGTDWLLDNCSYGGAIFVSRWLSMRTMSSGKPGD